MPGHRYTSCAARKVIPAAWQRISPRLTACSGDRVPAVQGDLEVASPTADRPGPLRASRPILVRRAIQADTSFALARDLPSHARHAAGLASQVHLLEVELHRTTTHRTPTHPSSNQDARAPARGRESGVGTSTDPRRAGPTRPPNRPRRQLPTVATGYAEWLTSLGCHCCWRTVPNKVPPCGNRKISRFVDTWSSTRVQRCSGPARRTRADACPVLLEAPMLVQPSATRRRNCLRFAETASGQAVALGAVLPLVARKRGVVDVHPLLIQPLLALTAGCRDCRGLAATACRDAQVQVGVPDAVDLSSGDHSLQFPVLVGPVRPGVEVTRALDDRPLT